jgi:hypothetical protein
MGDAIHPGLYKALHDRFGGPKVYPPPSSKGVTIARINPVNIVSSPLSGPGDVPSAFFSSSYRASYKNSPRRARQERAPR